MSVGKYSALFCPINIDKSETIQYKEHSQTDSALKGVVGVTITIANNSKNKIWGQVSHTLIEQVHCSIYDYGWNNDGGKHLNPIENSHEAVI